MSEIYKPSPASQHSRKANWDHKYRHENMSVDMDVWYPMLKSITFPTYFIHIKYREAEAILNYHFSRNLNKKDTFTKEDTNILIELEKKIDHYFNTIDDLKNGAMFRLSGRSGKDMDYYDKEKIFKNYQENLEKISKKLNKDKNDTNTKYVSIITLMDRFRVFCGKDVLNIILTSERLFLDIKDWLLHGGKEQIILRKWNNDLCSDKEFRGFIQENELKAICQDDRFGLFENSIKNKDLYETLINEFFVNKLKPLMKISNYIADFAIINNECKLIEFSPFLRCTSACLFRWDNDYEEMLHGNGKLTVRTEEYKDLINIVNEWEKEQSMPSVHFDDFFIKETKVEILKKYFDYINPINIYNKFFGCQENNNNNINNNKNIFVCGVLKKNCYWSKKYILYDDNKNNFLGKAVLNNYFINLDKNGFGWIMEEEGKKCYGEVYNVAYEDFLDIDYFYGQGDTHMKEIIVNLIDDEKNEQDEIKVYVYIIEKLFDNVKNDNEEIELEEYNIESQNEKFNPMQHVINQQERYLNMSLDFDLKDSW